VSLGVLFGQSIKAVGSATRVFEFVHATPDVPLHGGITLPDLEGNIRFDNISFNYPTRKEHKVLEHFTFDIPKGTMVALCGPSGEFTSLICQKFDFLLTTELNYDRLRKIDCCSIAGTVL
jgi:ATP-binding cassette subfamily B (MDR/TAP) protein 8